MRLEVLRERSGGEVRGREDGRVVVGGVVGVAGVVESEVEGVR